MEYKTRDITLAATLLTLGFNLRGLDIQVEGSKQIGYFSFEDTERLQEAINSYNRRELVVEPITFAGNMRSLKSQVVNSLRAPR